MVTDPVQHIRSRDYATSLDLHLTDPLRDLASVTATPQTPYLTVCLDWTPAFGDPGWRPPEELRRSEQRNLPHEAPSSRRPARGWFEREARALLDTLDERSEQRAHLEADIERITAWLDELDPAASGAYIASSSGQDVFVPLALGVPMTNAVTYRSLPAIDALAHVAEDYATYAVLTCDQQVAALSFITQGTKDQGIYLESTLYPRKQMQGGPNQRRYQNRANERVFHFARAISGEVAKALREEQVAVLVLVGSDEFMKELLNEFPEDVRALVAGAIPMDIQQEPAIADLIDVTAPVALEAERAREARAVAAIREVLGGGRAVAGTIDVLNALQAAQAMSLVINEDYHEHGWADYTFTVLGIGAAPDVHPTGGDVANIVEVDLEEAFIRLAFQQGADVEIVHTTVPFGDGGVDGMTRGGGLPRAEPAALLDDVGGVAAVLRYVP
jgi:hypothetical protein